ncbi:MAG: hypothetical protein V1797_04715 [Pseudomonadota bacterium]
MTDEQRRAALKARKQTLDASVKATLNLVREQQRQIKALRQTLATGPASVPEIAAAIDLAPARVLWLLASLRKYGQVSEVDKQGDYFRYAFNAPDQAGPAGEGEA